MRKSNWIISNLDRGKKKTDWNHHLGLPRTNISPSKMVLSNRNLQTSRDLFSGANCSFQEGYISISSFLYPHLRFFFSTAFKPQQLREAKGSQGSHGHPGRRKVIKTRCFFSCEISVSNYCIDDSWCVHHVCWKTKSLRRIELGGYLLGRDTTLGIEGRSESMAFISNPSQKGSFESSTASLSRKKSSQRMVFYHNGIVVVCSKYLWSPSSLWFPWQMIAHHWNGSLYRIFSGWFSTRFSQFQVARNGLAKCLLCKYPPCKNGLQNFSVLAVGGSPVFHCAMLTGSDYPGLLSIPK